MARSARASVPNGSQSALHRNDLIKLRGALRVTARKLGGLWGDSLLVLLRSLCSSLLLIRRLFRSCNSSCNALFRRLLGHASSLLSAHILWRLPDQPKSSLEARFLSRSRSVIRTNASPESFGELVSPDVPGRPVELVSGRHANRTTPH